MTAETAEVAEQIKAQAVFARWEHALEAEYAAGLSLGIEDADLKALAGELSVSRSKYYLLLPRIQSAGVRYGAALESHTQWEGRLAKSERALCAEIEADAPFVSAVFRAACFEADSLVLYANTSMAYAHGGSTLDNGESLRNALAYAEAARDRLVQGYDLLLLRMQLQSELDLSNEGVPRV